MNSNNNGPLKGVRVLELTTMVAGPMAMMMLGDQGADIIKVETPSGDLMRRLAKGLNGMNPAFLSANRNKRSIAVDLKKEEGRAILHKLIPSADVLAHNFRPGAPERLGVGEDVVRAIKPDIIYVSISGFGETGPYAGQRAYDPVIQAGSGLADVQRDRDTGRPRMIRTIIADYTTALTNAQAITAALFAKQRTGQGQHVRIAMLDAMISYLWPEAMPALTFVGEERDPSDGDMGPDLIFATQDRYITAGAMSDDEWAGMCRALKREDLIADERFKTAHSRTVNAVERREIMSSEFEKWNADEILSRLLANDVPSGPVRSRYELLRDPQVKAAEILEEHESPIYGKVRQPRPAARFSGTPATIRALAPMLGEHNATVLGEVGYTASDIERLERAGVIYRQTVKS